ncbi:MAG TPA: hypothetical protein P5511_00925 [Candidatus Goldiibacteriota bacterium]|nr:hypothetical protein [Candidatus Goldiibacteriota bacterium]
MKNQIKKIVFIAAFAGLGITAYGLEVTGLDYAAPFPYDDAGRKNPLFWNAKNLEDKHGISVFVYRYPSDFSVEPEKMARTHFERLTRAASKDNLLIWLSKKREKAVIMADPGIVNKVGKENIELLQNEVLRQLSGRWYISESKVSGKILGTILYLLDKEGFDKAVMKAAFVDIDNFFFSVSVKQPVRDLIGLFYLEPVSFFFYFPFIAYFVIVRFLGYNLGGKSYIVFTLIWAGLMLLVFGAIIGKVIILFEEYAGVASLFIAMNIPLYLYFYFMYRDRLERAAYEYVQKITGGFGNELGGLK